MLTADIEYKERATIVRTSSHVNKASDVVHSDVRGAAVLGTIINHVREY
jgi:hypothetical protein